MKNSYKDLSIIGIIGLSLALTLLGCLAGSPSSASAQVYQAQPGINAGITRILYLPLVIKDDMNLAVNPQDRQASLAFFNSIYRGSEGVPIDWTGNHDTCNEGTSSSTFRQAMQLRINYFRAMAGVPAITLSDDFNRKAQKAALMMSVNNALSHSPPSTWKCYTADGAQAAGSSNLFLGSYSVNAIDGYMYDSGSGDSVVGHRRWILYPQTQLMGTGDIPAVNGHPAANDLWVFDRFGIRPATREEFVAWPPPGYVPYQVVFPHWSFGYADADFTATSVSITFRGNTVPVSMDTVMNGYGENTLVWEPQISSGTPPASDEDYTVSIKNVMISGSPRNFVYHVIIFNPGVQATSGAISLERRLGIPLNFP
jgi:uncharacterized protein YkwD